MLKMHFCEQYWFFEWKTINYFAGIFNFLSWKKITGLLDLDLKELKNSFFVLSHDLSNISHKVVQQTIFS